MDSTLSAATTTTVFRRSNTPNHSTTGVHFHRNQVALPNVRQTSAAARAQSRRPLVGVPVCVSRSDVLLDSGGGGGGGETGGGGGGGGGGEVEVDPVMVGVDDGSDVSFDVIVLNVGGMTCGGCSGKVKRILESQPLVSAASVNHQTKMAIVWPVPEAKVTPNWQRVLGEELAKHLTTCGFNSNLRGEAATEDEEES